MWLLDTIFCSEIDTNPKKPFRGPLRGLKKTLDKNTLEILKTNFGCVVMAHSQSTPLDRQIFRSRGQIHFFSPLLPEPNRG